MPLKEGPPGYVWDDSIGAGRYRVLLPDGKLGRLVAEESIEEMLDTIHDRSANMFGQSIAGVYDEKVPLSVALLAFMGELKNLHLASAALGAGGWDRMNSSIYGRSGAILRSEYRYLANFIAEIERGALSRDEAINRAKLYADNAFGRYWTETTYRHQDAGFTEERLITEPGACKACLAAEATGWVPVGTYYVPMHVLCRCRKVFRR